MMGWFLRCVSSQELLATCPLLSQPLWQTRGDGDFVSDELGAGLCPATPAAVLLHGHRICPWLSDSSCITSGCCEAGLWRDLVLWISTSPAPLMMNFFGVRSISRSFPCPDHLPLHAVSIETSPAATSEPGAYQGVNSLGPPQMFPGFCVQPGDENCAQGLNSTQIRMFSAALWLVPGGDLYMTLVPVWRHIRTWCQWMFYPAKPVCHQSNSSPFQDSWLALHLWLCYQGSPSFPFYYLFPSLFFFSFETIYKAVSTTFQNILSLKQLPFLWSRTSGLIKTKLGPRNLSFPNRNQGEWLVAFRVLCCSRRKDPPL